MASSLRPSGHGFRLDFRPETSSWRSCTVSRLSLTRTYRLAGKCSAAILNLRDLSSGNYSLLALIDQNLKGAGQVFRAFLVMARTLHSFFFPLLFLELMLCSVGFSHTCLWNLMIFPRIKLKLLILRNRCSHMWTHYHARLPSCVFCLRFSHQSAPPVEPVFNNKSSTEQDNLVMDVRGGNDLGEPSFPPEEEQPLLPSQTPFSNT